MCCNKCGAELRDGAKFCLKCGQSISGIHIGVSVSTPANNSTVESLKAREEIKPDVAKNSTTQPKRKSKLLFIISLVIFVVAVAIILNTAIIPIRNNSKVAAPSITNNTEPFLTPVTVPPVILKDISDNDPPEVSEEDAITSVFSGFINAMQEGDIDLMRTFWLSGEFDENEIPIFGSIDQLREVLELGYFGEIDIDFTNDKTMMRDFIKGLKLSLNSSQEDIILENNGQSASICVTQNYYANNEIQEQLVSFRLEKHDDQWYLVSDTPNIGSEHSITSANDNSQISFSDEQNDNTEQNETNQDLHLRSEKPTNLMERESNDRPDQANEIDLGQSITGSLANTYKSERDWYIFTVSSNQNVHVTLKTLKQSNSLPYWDFYIYTETDIAPMNTPAGLAKQGAATAWGTDPFVDIPPFIHRFVRGSETVTTTDKLAEGTYYIRLESSNNHSRDEYTILLSEGSGGDGIQEYTLVMTTISGENIYERVYNDGYREKISEQGYYADLIRGYIDWSRWGKFPGSVSALDLAILADLSNKTKQEAIQIIIDTFPDTSPIRQSGFIHNSVFNVNYCVFPIDNEHAIVSFGGTNGFVDILTDINLFFGALPVGQTLIANNIVKDLSYKNIITTGFSLGGYIATDVRLNQNDKIVECITFNAPGRGIFNAAGQIFGSKDTRITNYAAIGDNVHNAGVHTGNEKSVTIDSDAIEWGALGKHDLQYIINTFIGTPNDSMGGDG